MTKQITDYLWTALGVEVKVSSYTDSRFPAFLGWNYDFFSFMLGEHSCLLAFKKPEVQLTPSAIAKNVGFLAAQTGYSVILGCDEGSA